MNSPTATLTPPSGPLDGMLTLSVAPGSASVGDGVVFTFVFANTGGGTVNDSLFSENLGVGLYGNSQFTCRIQTQEISNLRTGTPIDSGEVLTCSFPYRVAESDSVNGSVEAVVSLRVFSSEPVAGETSASVSLPVS